MDVHSGADGPVLIFIVIQWQVILAISLPMSHCPWRKHTCNLVHTSLGSASSLLNALPGRQLLHVTRKYLLNGDIIANPHMAF